VLVAWNGRRESGRAAFDALPLLKQAEKVRVISINAEDGEDRAHEVPSADLCTALARHKVKAEAAQASGTDSSAGAMLLAQAHNARCDLLVMGCYGHARLRELVFGGATLHVLRHMTVPVLMAH
jgi:nucleotide-binding universal stress UspA family protein